MEKNPFDFSKPEDQARFDQLPEYKKEDLIDKAHGEALYLNKEKNVGGFEVNLSPEVKEKILEKVGDVFAYGTASTSLLFAEDFTLNSDDKKLKSVLKNGVLGASRAKKGAPKPEDVSVWKQQKRDKHQVTVSFQIQGRSFYDSAELYSLIYGQDDKNYNSMTDEERSKVPCALDELQEEEHLDHNFSKEWFRGMAVVFNLDSYSEIPPLLMDENQDYEKPLPQKTFAYRGPKQYVSVTPNSKGDLCVGSEYGFSLSSRIPPREFRAIIVDYFGEQKLDLLVKDMVDINKDKPELLIPIYNTKGDLIWPEKRSYAEILEQRGNLQSLYIDKEELDSVALKIPEGMELLDFQQCKKFGIKAPFVAFDKEIQTRDGTKHSGYFEFHTDDVQESITPFKHYGFDVTRPKSDRLKLVLKRKE